MRQSLLRGATSCVAAPLPRHDAEVDALTDVTLTSTLSNSGTCGGCNPVRVSCMKLASWVQSCEGTCDEWSGSSGSLWGGPRSKADMSCTSEELVMIEEKRESSADFSLEWKRDAVATMEGQAQKRS